MEEVTAHCERCHDDKDATSRVEEERIQEQRRRADCLEAWIARRVEIAVDRVLRARVKMMKNNANGPSDCMVTDMLQALPMESVYETTHWFGKRFRAACRAPAARENSTSGIPQEA